MFTVLPNLLCRFSEYLTCMYLMQKCMPETVDFLNLLLVIAIGINATLDNVAKLADIIITIIRSLLKQSSCNVANNSTV